MTRAGELRHRITFQTASVTGGEGVTAWTDTLTVWGAVEPLTGSWLFQSQQANSVVSGIVRVPFNALINPSMRIKFGTRYLRINSIINPQERQRELQIMFSSWAD